MRYAFPALVAAVLAHGSAQAQPGLTRPDLVDPDTPADASREPESYSLAIAAVDIASLAGLLLAAELDRDEFAVGSAVTYVVGPSVVHFAKGRPERGLASVGLRLGAPLAGALAGGLLGSTQDGGETSLALEGALGGLIAGGAAAVVLDQFVLARPRRDPDDDDEKSPLVPSLAPSGGGFTIGLGGSF